MRTLLTALLAFALIACASRQPTGSTTPATTKVAPPRDDCPPGWTFKSNAHGSACTKPGKEPAPDCQPFVCPDTHYRLWDCPDPQSSKPMDDPRLATAVSLGYDNVREGAPEAGLTFALSPPISEAFPHGADRFMAEIQLTTSCQESASQPIFQQDHHRMYINVLPPPSRPSVVINGNTAEGEVSEVGYTFPLAEGLPIRGLWLHGYFLRLMLSEQCTLVRGISLRTIVLKGAQDREGAACFTAAQQ